MVDKHTPQVEMEAPALNLGASAKHIMDEGSRLLIETTPCKVTANRVYALMSMTEARCHLEDALHHVVGRDINEFGDGGVNFQQPIGFTNIFYGGCLCNDCSETGNCCGVLSSRRPPKLSASQLDAYVRLSVRLHSWATQARSFVLTIENRPTRPATRRWSAPPMRCRRDSLRKATKSINKIEQSAKKLLSLRLNAKRASINWAIVRVAVRRWKLAHFMFEAKQGPSYAPGGTGEVRDLNGSKLEFPCLL